MTKDAAMADMMDDLFLALRVRRWREAIEEADRFLRDQDKRLAEIRALGRTPR